MSPPLALILKHLLPAHNKLSFNDTSFDQKIMSFNLCGMLLEVWGLKVLGQLSGFFSLGIYHKGTEMNPGQNKQCLPLTSTLEIACELLKSIVE
jgi:hypothetical protein